MITGLVFPILNYKMNFSLFHYNIKAYKAPSKVIYTVQEEEIHLKIHQEEGCPLSLAPFNTVLEVLAKAIRQEKEIRYPN